MKPQRTYLKDATRAALSRDELPTPKGERVSSNAATVPPSRPKPYAVQVPAHIEKDDAGDDEIVIETRALSGRVAIDGKPFGDLKRGQEVTVRIGLDT